MIGIILLVLGIQGLIEVYNDKIQALINIKLYSIFFLIFGFFFTLISFLRLGERYSEIK